MFLSAGALILVTFAVLWGVRKPDPEEGPAPAATEETLVLYVEADGAALGNAPGVHVADVGFDAQGNAVLLRSSEPEIARQVQAALDEAQRQPALPLMTETPAVLDGRPGVGMDEAPVKKGTPGYAWALGGFVRSRTGLLYRVAPPAAAEH
ncbi:MAG: hypothetical protein A2X36_11375 [Elusimicrobia bacterium GWA2_69_24]|nr:MAG: hypothetical protein A2X36_11375 [Elusimicrobia bacterium GWA2_69_24]HBL17196.1 hypothetical protein [Elusimicrobiota bacterium]